MHFKVDLFFNVRFDLRFEWFVIESFEIAAYAGKTCEPRRQWHQMKVIIVLE